jgi:hypothetical protein
MTKLRWLLLAAIAITSSLPADTISQTSAQGKQVVIQRDAIVVKEDSNYLFYKHFDLRERRVMKVGLNKGSLPYRVSRSPEADRQQIVGIWKRFGYKVTVTDQAGKTTEVFDAFLDFYPPGGRGSLLDSVPPRTTLPLMVEDGTPDEVEFSKIARVEIQGQQMKVTLRTGEVRTARFLMPTSQPAEARLLGITDHYDPASQDVFDFSLPLERVKELRFASD